MFVVILKFKSVSVFGNRDKLLCIALVALETAAYKSYGVFVVNQNLFFYRSDEISHYEPFLQYVLTMCWYTTVPVRGEMSVHKHIQPYHIIYVTINSGAFNPENWYMSVIFDLGIKYVFSFFNWFFHTFHEVFFLLAILWYGIFSLLKAVLLPTIDYIPFSRTLVVSCLNDNHISSP